VTGAPALIGSFFEGAVLSLVFPLALLLAVVAWWYIAIRRRHPDGRKR
jgi:uncharacterized membrane protein YhaH (DUF805 family)